VQDFGIYLARALTGTSAERRTHDCKRHGIILFATPASHQGRSLRLPVGLAAAADEAPGLACGALRLIMPNARPYSR
jgi:hypothetical protein